MIRASILRIALLAAFLSVVMMRWLLAVQSHWCYHDPLIVIGTMWLLAPGGIVTDPEVQDPTSTAVLVAVAISAVTWAVCLWLGWRAYWRVSRDPRPSFLSWRPWVTWHLIGAVIVIGAWCEQTRAADVRGYERCQRVIEQIPTGAMLSDVEDAFYDARPAVSEFEDCLAPDTDRIDALCRQAYGTEAVEMRVHMAGDVVERVDRQWRRETCSLTVEFDPPGRRTFHNIR